MTWGTMVNTRRMLTILSLVILITLAILFACFAALFHSYASIPGPAPTPALGDYGESRLQPVHEALK